MSSRNGEIQPGQVVVVTGASAGVGRATAVALVRRCAHVALVARGESGLKGAVDEIEAAGGFARAFPADMAQAEQAEAVARDVEESLGEIDLWVNVAFTSVFAKFMDIEPDEFKRVTEVDYLGYVYGTRAALKRMLPRDRGTVVQVGSALAYRGIPLQSAYCGSKHAIQGFNESLRCELLHDKSNVHVTMVQLPAVNTPQFDWVRSRLRKPAQPVPPIYQPELAAEGIVRGRAPAPPGVLGGRQHGGHAARERGGTRPAGPVPRSGRRASTRSSRTGPNRRMQIGTTCSNP
jgi:short-subunit dehydrogenase